MGTLRFVRSTRLLVEQITAEVVGGASDGRRVSFDPDAITYADVFVVAPASANTLAKLATGQADNLLTSAALAATCPVIVAPAMNNHMWEHPATRANLETLRARGAVVVEPGTGELASKGEYGAGRLAEPPQWDGLQNGLAYRLAQHIGQLGLDVAGRNCVHRNVARGDLARGRLGKPDDSSLGRRVIGLPSIAHQPDN